MAGRGRSRSRSRSPRRGLEYDGYSSDSRAYGYRSPRGLARYNYRLPYGGGRRSRSTSDSLRRQMGAMSLGGGRAWSERSTPAWDDNDIGFRPTARPTLTDSSSTTRSTGGSVEWPRAFRLRRRSRSPRHGPRPIAHLSSPEIQSAATSNYRPRAWPTSSSLDRYSESAATRSNAASAQSEMSTALAPPRRAHALDLLTAGPRRSNSSSRLEGAMVAIDIRGPRGRTRRHREFGDISSLETDNRSLTPGFADAYRAAVLQGDSQSTRSRRDQERREQRRAEIVELQQRLAQHGGPQGHVLPLLAPLYNPRRRNDQAESRMYTVEEQERRNLDDAAGLLEDGQNRVPYVYRREEPFQVYRYHEGPYYADRPVSPQRQRSGYNWIYHQNDMQFSDATAHHSEDRGSLYGQDLWDGTRRADFQAFRHHPHFSSVAEDQRFGVGGNRWTNPNNPRRHNPPPPVVQDVTDQNF